MKTRHACFLALGGALSAGAFMVACGSSPSGEFDGGGGADAALDTTSDHMATSFDVTLPDTNQTQPDGVVPDSPLGDGSEGGIVDSGIVGNCSPVNGPACDLVKQNCKTGEECIVVESKDAALGATTQCVPTTASEHLPVGSACCPNAATNPCNQGLTCIGNDCLGDAGPGGGGGGNCTPACCSGADGGVPSNNCGTSPEGYIGQCDLSITGPSSQVWYAACTYSAKCIPLDVAPCGEGYTCTVNEAGAGDCISIDGPDGGATGALPGASCMFANYCAQGLTCAGTGPTSSCLYQCYTGMGPTPFDAGLVNTSVVGHGGCPSGNTCDGVTGFPDWLGVCVPP